MRVALFGGSFNPPHVGHQLLALYVLETANIDELWFVPTFQHAFHKTLEPFPDRLRMCELAAEALGPRARVSDVEARLGGESWTLRTVRKLLEDHPGVAFSLVIGSDLVGETDAWHGVAELRALVPFLVVARGGHPGGPPSGSDAVAAPVTMPEISSTTIRAGLRAGQAMDAWIPRRVLDYIGARRLYGGEPSR
ncbi:MAG TPA: nicotinate (nicotinamide) nucleotide adenylyltransferase [Polyangia bacterium]|jgi:nicotinate-nucleotide adenylyltransferase